MRQYIGAQSRVQPIDRRRNGSDLGGRVCDAGRRHITPGGERGAASRSYRLTSALAGVVSRQIAWTARRAYTEPTRRDGGASPLGWRAEIEEEPDAIDPAHRDQV
jgi:hypothetical protein